MGDVNGGPETRAESAERISQRPLVTFALFAYNQERYVREAIEGAFSQTYEPLEIILSDDCSTDRTFEIMQEMAAAYRGPHRVQLNRPPVNLGLVRHVLNVVEITNSEFMVLAAGDDISKPNRTDDLVRLWRDSGGWGFYSRFDLIDDSGVLLREYLYSPPDNKEILKLVKSDDSMDFIHGATSAYDTRVFKYIPEPAIALHNEDAILSVALNLLDKGIRFADKSLLKYRMHSQAASNAIPAADTINDLRITEKDNAVYARRVLNLCDYIANELVPYIANSFPYPHRSLNCDEIQRLRDFYTMQSEMANADFMARVGMMLRFRNAMAWRWLVVRLFGINMLWLIRKCGRLVSKPKFVKYR
ncbi:MAG TPA: glycosyltransferase [Methylocella sp.]|jgi:glycosyltransferase involved in cell wall biosynthesis